MRADLRTAVRVTILLVIAYVVVRVLQRSWDEIRTTAAGLQPSWSGIALASACVAAGYAILIGAWRLLLARWRSPLGVIDAARIWFVSSLGKYVPGKIWSIGAMAVLAKEAGASPVAATGSSIIMMLVNIAAGFAVVALAGAGELLSAHPVLRIAAWSTIVATAFGLLYGPRLLTWAVRTGSRLLKRPMPDMPVLSRGLLLLIFGANVAAWIAYGVAFGIFWSALLGHGGGISLAALAVYTASYLMGFLVLVAPGGVGVRETVLVGLLSSLKLATPADAVLLATTSRIWLTVLEILPGLVFLPGTSLRRRSSISTHDGPAA
ncbi:MAG TPA: lysylphosphatidylglycerol synthase domain-containing protein [Gemmatimonadaceae bacterium]|nr:lysylphosphatidylglycerol synthase domain-containing protein [Gemmatimonadaceae bacterium]